MSDVSPNHPNCGGEVVDYTTGMCSCGAFPASKPFALPDADRAAIARVLSGEDRGCIVLAPDFIDATSHIPNDTIHASISDPPYGIGKREPTPEEIVAFLTGAALDTGGDFMSRDWQIPTVKHWKEIFRVLRPGAHLLAFGSSRTDDLISIAIRMAGFERRDKIEWLYGSAMPHGANVSALIDKMRDDRSEWHVVARFLRAARKASGVTNAAIDEAFGFNGMAAHWFKSSPSVRLPSNEQWAKLKEILRFGDSAIDAIVAAMNERKGEAGEDWKSREVVGTRAGYTEGGFGDVGHQKEVAPDAVKVTRAKSPAAQAWIGWHTALKPAHEPILVFRKPIPKSAGSFARNVLEHGTGALNIDASRVSWGSDKPTQEEWNRAGSSGAAGANGFMGQISPGMKQAYADGKMPVPSGRWPANVITSHCPECQEVGSKRVKADAPGNVKWSETTKNAFGSFEARSMVSHADEDGNEEVAAYECLAGCAACGLAVLVASGGDAGACACGHARAWSCPCAELDAQSGDTGAHGRAEKDREYTNRVYGAGRDPSHAVEADAAGGASRFFYCAKASGADRDDGLEREDDAVIEDGARVTEIGQMRTKECNVCGTRAAAPGAGGRWPDCDHDDWKWAERKPGREALNDWPTVKPTRLMEYLCALVTPPNGIVLDQTSGSGTTNVAAVRRGFRTIGIDRDPDATKISEPRLARAILDLTEERTGQRKLFEEPVARTTKSTRGQRRGRDSVDKQPQLGLLMSPEGSDLDDGKTPRPPETRTR
jgi:DNA modification methylase